MPNDPHPEAIDARFNKLEGRFGNIERLLVEIQKAGNTDYVLGGGFGSVSDQLETVSLHLKTISAQMAPLAELTQEPALSEDAKKRLAYLIQAWAPPNWEKYQPSSLSFDAKAVRYIGEMYIGEIVPEQRGGDELDDGRDYRSTAP